MIQYDEGGNLIISEESANLDVVLRKTQIVDPAAATEIVELRQLLRPPRRFRPDPPRPPRGPRPDPNTPTPDSPLPEPSDSPLPEPSPAPPRPPIIVADR